MIFIAHVTSENYEYEPKKDEFLNKNDIITFPAECFTDACRIIEFYYSKDLISINLLEPISDSSIIFLTPKAEQEIRHHEYNTF